MLNFKLYLVSEILKNYWKFFKKGEADSKEIRRLRYIINSVLK